MSKIADATFKIILIGESRVGKTSLTSRYLTGLFDDDIKRTIGVNIEVKDMIKEGLNIKLQIWDFGGEERFRFFLPSYVSGASAGIFMYDITRYESLNNIKAWLEVFKSGFDGISRVPPILMVGGKLDLCEYRELSYSEAFHIAENHGFSGYVECSAKNGINVESTFDVLVDLILKRIGLK